MVWAAGRPARALIPAFLRIAKMVKCRKSHLKAFTKRNCLGLQKPPFFIILTVKRNVLGHFGHVHFVILVLGWPGFPSETYSSKNNNPNANGAGIPRSIDLRSGSRFPVRVYNSCRSHTRTVLLSDTNAELIKRSGSGFGQTNWKPERCQFLGSLFS